MADTFRAEVIIETMITIDANDYHHAHEVVEQFYGNKLIEILKINRVVTEEVSDGAYARAK